MLHPHFVKEEQFALPPLSPLPRGEQRSEMRDVLRLTDKPKEELPRMLEEHRAIVTALDKLAEAALAEARPEVAAFAEKLKLHAQTEEQVSYPAALLIGEYVKLKLG